MNQRQKSSKLNSAIVYKGSEDRYRTLVERLQEGVAQVDGNGNFITVNSAAARIHGYKSPLDMIGKVRTGDSYCNPLQREEIHKAIKLHGSWVGEVEMRKRDGSIIWLLSTCNATVNQNGEVIGYEGVFADVTERKRAELELRQSEQKYRELADTLPEIYLELEPIGTITYANRNAIASWGYSRDELIGKKNFKDLLIPEHAKQSHARGGHILAGRKFPPREYTAVRKDGSTFTMLVQTNTMKKDGLPSGLRCVAVDITERKRVDEEFNRISERFSGMYSSSKDAMSYTDLNGMILDVNESFCQLTGYSKAELTAGMKHDDITPESFMPLSRKKVDYVLETGLSTEYEKEFIREDGICVPILITTFAVKGREGYPIGLATIIKDITERKQAELTLHKSEELLRRIFESTTDGIAVTDFNGIITDTNVKMLQMHGYASKYELVGQNILEIVAHYDRQRAMESLKRCMQMNSSKAGEYQFINNNGAEFTGEVDLGVIRDASGNSIASIITIRDITQQKHTQQIMQNYIVGNLKAQEEERKRIARELHDDTVQSLASITMDIEAITRSAGKLPDKTMQLLQQLREKLGSVIEDVRNICHELRPDVLDQLGLIPAIHLLLGELKRHGLRTEIRVTGSERRLSTEVELMLFRITQEALHNINKHAYATEASVQVQFDPDQVILTVKDNGRGFEVSEWSKLSHSGKLGLLGMQERAKLFGAILSIKSQPGKYTSVTVQVKA